ncbi:MAG: glycosyltransferase family 2 protein [Methanobacteriaceae archaeon]|nr:glycosyltransferase family 2 protein [Methanobacteriaceae archaeon]MDP2837443.1 glycosyltransferase family 2 protein [Methanobacteriaceae archaeon]MDP3035612.1 glycosyltransferase family 2 protein [Methanobacteriaceae archaeon]MDP3484273.1 glycosyltransferase family 2 protein [Methanobacteriaceae archaeon]
MTKYNLTVAYRIYPKVSKVPPLFKDDKYKLSEFCIESFKRALGNLKVKIIVLFDNCPLEYENLFKNQFDKEDLEFIHLEGVGNQATFKLQIETLLSQNYSELVYFAEDDYFYMPNAFEEMMEIIKNDDVDFISPYDHLDYYNYIMHNHKVLIKATDKRHWKTSTSTCLTFLTDKKTLLKSRRTFESYTKGNWDSSLWLALSKEGLWNPFRVLTSLLRGEKLFAAIILMAWRYCWLQILFGRVYKLWTPIPTLGIHLESDYLPPTEKCLDYMLKKVKQS